MIEEDMKHLKIDITFSDQEEEAFFVAGIGFAQPVHMGIKCCDFIKQKLLEYPSLEPLTLILKKFLAIRDLNSPFLGKNDQLITIYRWSELLRFNFTNPGLHRSRLAIYVQYG